jgi:hypothetical protein
MNDQIELIALPMFDGRWYMATYFQHIDEQGNIEYSIYDGDDHEWIDEEDVILDDLFKESEENEKEYLKYCIKEGEDPIGMLLNIQYKEKKKFSYIAELKPYADEEEFGAWVTKVISDGIQYEPQDCPTVIKDYLYLEKVGLRWVIDGLSRKKLEKIEKEEREEDDFTIKDNILEGWFIEDVERNPEKIKKEIVAEAKKLLTKQ